MASSTMRKPVNKNISYNSTPAVADRERAPEDAASSPATALFLGLDSDPQFHPTASAAAKHDYILPLPTPSSSTTNTQYHDQTTISSALATQQREKTSSQGQAQETISYSTPYVSWEIHWQKPIFIWTLLFSGLILSLGHHLYYLSLNGTLAGNAAKQAWPVRFGTAFAFLITSCLQAVTTTAIGQYFWCIVRRKPLTVAGLDKLYSITSNPVGIASIELVRTARIAVILAVIFWCLGFAAVAPPAALTVAAKNITVEASVPVFDFLKAAWNIAPQDWQPQSITHRIASESAISMDIAPFTPPIASEYWSYDLQFFGPTVQCHAASNVEQQSFDNLTAMFEAQDSVFIYSKAGENLWNEALAAGRLVRLLYSALAPYLPANTPGYWLPSCPSDGTSCEWQSRKEIWLQLSNSSIVCNSVNASFEVTIASVGGTQQITERAITVVGNYSTFQIQQQVDTIQAPKSRNGSTQTNVTQWSPYLSHYYALGALLIGNISLSGTVVSENGVNPIYSGDDNTPTNDATTDLLATGLVACDEIQNSPFISLSVSSKLGNQTQAFIDTFPTEVWMCRNGSLVQAIEDLSNNITISFLSSPDLTNDDTLLRNITTSNTVNVYQYHPLYLLLSYGIGLLFASFAAVVGLYSLYINGTSHATSFSAIMATTRNSDLDSLTRGSSLGAEPLNTRIGKAKLRFGPLLKIDDAIDLKRKVNGRPVVAKHTGFGFEGTVGYIERGAWYT